jgi:hypothetical protein
MKFYKLFIILFIYPLKSLNFIKKQSSKLVKFFNKSIKLTDNNIPIQHIEIIEYNDEYVIVKGTHLLGIKHCFFKAIEFFDSKYKNFFLRIQWVKKENNWIIVKFIVKIRD